MTTVRDLGTDDRNLPLRGRSLAGVGLGRVGALRAATSNAAKVLATDGLGRLAEGSPADVVAVRGDPTQNLDVLSEPLLVIRSGAIQVGG